MTEVQLAQLWHLVGAPTSGFKPENDLRDAFQIVERTSEQGWHWFFDNRPRGDLQTRDWVATCSQPLVCKVIRRFRAAASPRLEEAICQAALLALEEQS